MLLLVDDEVSTISASQFKLRFC